MFAGDGLVVLADGMGGRAGGQPAAHAAVGAALRNLAVRTESAVRESFDGANAAVREYQLSTPEHPDAGCTLTIVGIREVPAIGLQAIVGHAGDSPAFLIRDSDMTLLTPPHTTAEHLLREGRITEEEATTHPGRHTLQRSVGARAELEPEVRIVASSPGIGSWSVPMGFWMYRIDVRCAIWQLARVTSTRSLHRSSRSRSNRPATT